MKENLETFLDQLLDLIKKNWKPNHFNSNFIDGRRTSQNFEDYVLKIIYKEINQLKSNFVFEMFKSKPREWYDIAFKLQINNLNIFIPINIKSTTFLNPDNLSSKSGVYYSLTGKKPNNINSWDLFFKSLFFNIPYDLNDIYDYYLIVLDKNNLVNGKSYWTSLRRIPKNEFIINGNNLPFQIKYSGLKIAPRLFKTHKSLLLNIIFSSLLKRSLISFQFINNSLENTNDNELINFLYENNEFKKLLKNIKKINKKFIDKK